MAEMTPLDAIYADVDQINEAAWDRWEKGLDAAAPRGGIRHLSEAWKAKVRAAVERFEERQGKALSGGDAVNADGRKGGSPDPAVTANGETSCPSPLYP